MRKQQGFTLYLIIGLLLAIAAAGMFYQLWQSKKAEHESFVIAVKVAGDAQEAKTKATIEQQKRSADEAEKRSKRSLADIRAKYDRLRGSDTRSGVVPAVPDTAPIADGKARDSRLLAVLQHAEEQSRQLNELQAWITEQGAAR